MMLIEICHSWLFQVPLKSMGKLRVKERVKKSVWIAKNYTEA